MINNIIFIVTIFKIITIKSSYDNARLQTRLQRQQEAMLNSTLLWKRFNNRVNDYAWETLTDEWVKRQFHMLNQTGLAILDTKSITKVFFIIILFRHSLNIIYILTIVYTLYIERNYYN